eukprot:439408-Prorocentrum_minimum.AAC.2
MSTLRVAVDAVQVDLSPMRFPLQANDNECQSSSGLNSGEHCSKTGTLPSARAFPYKINPPPTNGIFTHDGPIGRRTHRYIRMVDQSNAAGLCRASVHLNP